MPHCLIRHDDGDFVVWALRFKFYIPRTSFEYWGFNALARGVCPRNVPRNSKCPLAGDNSQVCSAYCRFQVDLVSIAQRV